MASTSIRASSYRPDSRFLELFCEYVSLYGYAFRRALRYEAETWHGGRTGPGGKRARSSRGQVTLEMPYDHQIW